MSSLLRPDIIVDAAAVRSAISDARGHVPSAKNLPFATLIDEAGTFKTREALEKLMDAAGATPDKWGATPASTTAHGMNGVAGQSCRSRLARGAATSRFWGMPERLVYMYLPPEAFRLVPFTPGDLEAAKKAIACHHSQFTAETLQRLLPAMQRLWNGAVPFIPGSPAVSGDDLFR